MSIYKKMLEITNELGTVAKNLNVSISKTASYKAVSEVDILNAVKPLEHNMEFTPIHTKQTSSIKK